MKPAEASLAFAAKSRYAVEVTEDRYRQVTSLRRGPPDGSAFAGVRKALHIPAHGSVTLFDVHGSGRIVRFWLTLPHLAQRHVLKTTVLRIFWDGEEQPSVEVPLGDFFGAAFGQPRPLVSSQWVIAGGAYLCRFVMPFNRGARIELRNDSSRSVRHVFYQIGYYEEAPRHDPEPTLHAHYRQTRAKAGAPAVQILEARGRGRFVGLHLDIESRSWWLRPPLSHIALPRGFGLGLLEGWETIVVDGDTDNALIGTGAEDYFLGGFYFKGAPFSTPTHGCSHRSFFAGRVSAYRLHEDDAIPFDESLSFSLDHGLNNQMAGHYHSTAFWYQSEPHFAFRPLPHEDARRFGRAWVSPLQWLLLVALAIGLLAGLAAALITAAM